MQKPPSQLCFIHLRRVCAPRSVTSEERPKAPHSVCIPTSAFAIKSFLFRRKTFQRWWDFSQQRLKGKEANCSMRMSCTVESPSGKFGCARHSTVSSAHLRLLTTIPDCVQRLCFGCTWFCVRICFNEYPIASTWRHNHVHVSRWASGKLGRARTSPTGFARFVSDLRWEYGLIGTFLWRTFVYWC